MQHSNISQDPADFRFLRPFGIVAVAAAAAAAAAECDTLENRENECRTRSLPIYGHEINV
jgi:hypothetical protein